MKIIVEHYDEKVSIETNRDDLTIDEFIDNLKRIASAIYNEKLVEDYWK